MDSKNAFEHAIDSSVLVLARGVPTNKPAQQATQMEIRLRETLQGADLAVPTAAGGKILPLRRRLTARRQGATRLHDLNAGTPLA
jgi:hypothetical protein